MNSVYNSLRIFNLALDMTMKLIYLLDAIQFLINIEILFLILVVSVPIAIDILV